MPRFLPLVAVALFGFAVVGDAQEPTKRPVGTWTREINEAKVEFNIKQDSFVLTIKAGDLALKIDGDYSITKDNIVFGRISKVDMAPENGPKAGDLFGFKIAVKDKILTITDLLPPNEGARQLVEGEYTKK